jgi:hypothetical protein
MLHSIIRSRRFLRKADGAGDDRHRQMGCKLRGGAKPSLGVQPVDDRLGLAFHLLLERSERNRRNWPNDHTAQPVMGVAITAQRIAAQELVHVVVHHDAERRRECLPIPKCFHDGVITGDGKHCVFFQPDDRPHPAELAVQRPGVQQRSV